MTPNPLSPEGMSALQRTVARRCWVLHKWTRWELHSNVLAEGTKSIHGFSQTRQCLRCGMVQLRMEKI